MLPTSSITMLDFAFAFIFVVVFCEALRIAVVGMRNLQMRHDDPGLDRSRPAENLTKFDGA